MAVKRLRDEQLGQDADRTAGPNNHRDIPRESWSAVTARVKKKKGGSGVWGYGLCFSK